MPVYDTQYGRLDGGRTGRAGRRGRGGVQTNNLNYTSDISAQILEANNGGTGQTGTFSTSQIIDAICEGPIEGWPTNEPLKYIYLDGTPVQAYSGSFNKANLRHEFRNGTSDQSVLSQYTLISAAKTPNFQDELLLNNSITQQVQIRDDSDGAYPPVEAVAFTFTFPEGLFRYRSSGGRDSTSLGFTIEVNNKSDGSGTWTTRFNWVNASIELTNAPFDWTFIVELPPGWSTPAALQKYASTVDDVILFRITKTLDDSSNDRAHSRMYLKNYSIYTRNQFTYPYTALMGLTIDSKNFDGSIPRRMYELKLLKVKVPSNYNLVFETKTGKVVERNYEGQWDGTFKEGVWTDNPVWCFYDLVTNTRYGLGNYIDSSLLNKWKLYEIAKYCDAVVADTRGGKPANSYTFSIPDQLGGVIASAANSAIKEPRFTCNIMISSREEAYSVVQRMASLFRGITFFQQGTLEVVQDRPATPTYLYNNTNVIDGTFSYSSSSGKARHTVAIVKWVDPEDLYSEKLEYVEDYDGIARYGYREIEIDGFGCTSRGQARRVGRHILITEKFELETVSFRVGMEGAIVTPGSLIKIKDSYRQTYRASGRIAAATSSYVTLDKEIQVPTGASSVSLWLQTANARDYIIDEGTAGQVNIGSTLRPTLKSYSINVPPFNPAVLNLSPTSTISPVPVAGNIWGLSYTQTGDTENTSVYKVLSVVENNSFEYEITALQHVSTKYDDIESYAPIPSYKPLPLKLFTPAPTEGFISSKFNGKTHDVTITWRSDRYISGTKYRLEVVNGTTNKVIYQGTDTSFIYYNVGPGIYYFKIYSLNSVTSQASEPLILGPFKVREVMPQYNFDVFNQVVGDTYVKHYWKKDKFVDDPVKYELWRTASPQILLRSPSEYNPITNRPQEYSIKFIDRENNKIQLRSFARGTLDRSPTFYNAEITLYPYVRYGASSVGSVNTSPNMIVLNTEEKPSVLIGDKLTNCTRNTTTNIWSINQYKNSQNRWISELQVTPSVTSQASGDIVFPFKGVIGTTLTQTQPSAVIKQRTFNAVSGTTTTKIQVATSSVITNVSVGDVVVNRTRNTASLVTSKTASPALNISPSISGQTTNDIIAYYQAGNRQARKLNDYTIDYIKAGFGGDILNVLNYDNPNYIPIPNKSIMVNTTKGKAAEVIKSDLKPGGVLEIVTVPSNTPNIADLDKVIFFDKDEVYTASISTHIHPTVGLAQAGTSPRGITCTGLFTNAQKGDIVVNATRNSSAVVNSKVSNNQVTLAGIVNSSLAIPGQTTGDAVFLIESSTMTSFNEDLSYAHPTIYTAASGTSSTTIVISPGNIIPSGSPVLYNMTKNNYSKLTGGGNNTATLQDTFDQSPGNKVYFITPGVVSNTVVTAVDSAFSYARPGDIFYNVTRDDMATIKDVKTLSGKLDKRIDRLVLNAPILAQAVGQEFRIVQGFFNSQLVSTSSGATYGGGGDAIELELSYNFELGDSVVLWYYNAENVGVSSSNHILDTGLSPEQRYEYWMRPVSARLPYIGGMWVPGRYTGDTVITYPRNMGNYNKSNDNNGDPIDPAAISPVFPFMDVPSSPYGRNPDSTANVRLLWEWTGQPRSIDGFIIYFWSSNTDADDPAIDNDNDFTQATTTFVIPANRRVPILAVSPSTPTAGATRITTLGPHNLVEGDTLRLTGIKTTEGTQMTNINNNGGGTDYYKASQVTQNTVVVSPQNTPAGVYNPGTGKLASCKYSYQMNSLTANYYYNAWIQPYRMVNSEIDEDGIIVGSPRRLYSPS